MSDPLLDFAEKMARLADFNPSALAAHVVAEAKAAIAAAPQPPAEPYAWSVHETIGGVTDERFSRGGPKSRSDEDKAAYDLRFTPLYKHPPPQPPAEAYIVLPPMPDYLQDGILSHETIQAIREFAIAAVRLDRERRK